VQVSIGLKQPTSPWGPPQQTHPEVRLPEPHCIKPLISLGVIGMIWHTLTTACALDTHNCTEARKNKGKSCILKVEKEFFWRVEAVESVMKKGLWLSTFINAVASYKSYGTSNQGSPRWVWNAGKTWDIQNVSSLQASLSARERMWYDEAFHSLESKHSRLSEKVNNDKIKSGKWLIPSEG
jgi:hypothetical protein